MQDALSAGKGSEVDRVRALDGACWIAYNYSDFHALAAFASEQAGFCERLGDRRGLASALTSLGAAALFKDQDLEVAESFIRRSLELSEPAGCATQASEALTMLGLIAFWRDDLEAVEPPWERSLQLCEEAGDVPQHIRMLADMTCLNLIRGHFAQAAQSAAAARAAYRAIPIHHNMEEMLLECCAWLAIEAGHDERGLELAGAARARYRLSGHGKPPTWERYWGPVLRRTMAAMPAGVAERALSEGMQLDRERAFVLAETLLAPGPAGDRRYIEVAGVRLTRRERDVALMVAKGMSNRQIASKLVLTERTVEGHVENLLSKLGFHSRAGIAAWVAGKDLATERSP